MKKLLYAFFIVAIILTTLVVTVSAAEEYIYNGLGAGTTVSVLNGPSNLACGYMNFSQNGSNKVIKGFCIDYRILAQVNSVYEEATSLAAAVQSNNSPEFQVKAEQLLFLANYLEFGELHINPPYLNIPTFYERIKGEIGQLTAWKIMHGESFSTANLDPATAKNSADGTQRLFTEEFFAKYRTGELESFYRNRLSLANATVSISGSLKLNNETNSHLFYGPLTVNVSNSALNNVVFGLSLNGSYGSGVTIVDANGVAINKILPNTPFYVKIDNSLTNISSISISAVTLEDYIYAYDVVFLAGKDSQPVFIYVPLSKSYSAQFNGTIQYKSLGDSAWAGYVTSNAFPKGGGTVSKDGLVTRKGGSAWDMAVKFDGTTIKFEMIAGQYTPVGYIIIEKVANQNKLQVTYYSYAGYKLTNLHCGAYKTIKEIPGANGQLMKKCNGTMVGNVVTIPYTGGTIYVAAHCEV